MSAAGRASARTNLVGLLEHPYDQLHPIGDTDSPACPVEVSFHGGDRQVELAGDLLVAMPPHDQLDDAGVLWGEPEPLSDPWPHAIA